MDIVALDQDIVHIRKIKPIRADILNLVALDNKPINATENPGAHEIVEFVISTRIPEESCTVSAWPVP